ncbi:hypothetical protein HPB52_017552 [Rhipicephalus sanguineus]|uniref:Uncharacterized protein n=1 Tax=Rhipicephalus sanguineus TaxID=34632 RepID=A0A9D4SR29_RHISA|nr:hypothetical protein HPB52_017552 [Rhipicephalus sanguineus]
MSSQPSPTLTHSNGSKTFFESFHVVNAYYRFLGYSFLSRERRPDDDPGLENVVCKRRSQYAVYAVASWVVLIAVFAYDSYEVLKMFNDSESIEKAVTLAYSTRTLIIQVFNFCATIERAPRLACLANSFGDLERRLPVLASLKTPAFLIVGLNVALAVLLFVSIVPLLFLFADYTQDMLAWNEFYGVVCLFHGQAACMITYTWIMFYSKTLASYIQAINDQLRDMQASLEEEDEIAPKVLGVDELHRLFYEIMEVFWKFQSAFGLSLFIVVPLNLLVAAPWTYFVIKQLHRPEVSLINALGCVALCAQMVIVSLCAVLPNKQIQEFRHTCIHQEFRFSALGFFKVGPPLVVSVSL